MSHEGKFWENNPNFGEIEQSNVEGDGKNALRTVLSNVGDDFEAIDKLIDRLEIIENPGVSSWEWKIIQQDKERRENTPDRQRAEDLLALAKDLAYRGIVTPETLAASRTFVGLEIAEYKGVIADQESLLTTFALEDGFDLTDEDITMSMEDAEKIKAEYQELLEQAIIANSWITKIFIKQSSDSRGSSVENPLDYPHNLPR